MATVATPSPPPLPTAEELLQMQQRKEWALAHMPPPKPSRALPPSEDEPGYVEWHRSHRPPPRPKPDPVPAGGSNKKRTKRRNKHASRSKKNKKKNKRRSGRK